MTYKELFEGAQEEVIRLVAKEENKTVEQVYKELFFEMADALKEDHEYGN